jgi:hypothetical protein
MYGPASSGGVTFSGWRPGLCRGRWAFFAFGRAAFSSCGVDCAVVAVGAVDGVAGVVAAAVVVGSGAISMRA